MTLLVGVWLVPGGLHDRWRPTVAAAVEFRSIAEPAAVLYDAPSLKANKRGILGAGYPVEIIVTLDKWTKVRDATGDLAWLETRLLSVRRMLMVKVAKSEVRKAPKDDAAIAFVAEQDVLLEWLETVDHWAKVKHRDGATGYIKIVQVWGQ